MTRDLYPLKIDFRFDMNTNKYMSAHSLYS